MTLVLVQYDFDYTAKDGCLVSIKPNESYMLVCKTNEHWWRVRRDQCSRPFYVPAQYVKEVPDRPASPEMGHKVTGEMSSPQGASGENCRFSTHGFCWDVPETDRPEQSNSIAAQAKDKENSSSSSFNSQQNDSSGLYAIPVPGYRKKSESSLQDHELKHDDDMDFPPPPDLPELDLPPEANLPEFDEIFEPPEPDFKAKLQWKAGHGVSSTEPSTDQVEDDASLSAVYVNVAQLRQSISRTPPSRSPSYLDLNGWEVHVDQESGQEYYYHPDTGQTTWDKPFLDSPTYPESLDGENPLSPSPPLSPAFSPSTASPSSVRTADWEQLVDESSGRPYFYNPMSGETTWEPPEQLSPYSPMTEPMSVHRFHEDQPPPLPEEDYPHDEDHDAEEPEELLATGPPTLPREYVLSHAGRPLIPRATLDRSTSAGWTLNVDPTGAWVFTSELSPEQWIKSVDDRGYTYYYLRDGSRSLWNLPEAPVAPGQSVARSENGVEAENTSVIKNWRHTMGPAQLGSPQDDGRFFQTHRRNTSDYSSDSSSTGNSPETQHNAFGYTSGRKPYYLTSRWLRFNVQNLEKAGILNKTKVAENGKKVRKNWTQTWTVLHGGVLTFHKDPKSTAPGASSKTNQIVPEFTVDLKGATLCWATKDKSSKKNVLELKTKNGVEFLVQYDTESIIIDWHRVLTDTIRQLEYQDHPSDEEDVDLYEKIASTDPARDERIGSGADKRRSTRQSVAHSSSSAGDTDPKKVRTKLMKFLMKRPTLQSVKEKGYIRDNVFGCHLATLCAQEKTTVPRFVEKCIKAVEKRGLEIDGLYRVSGNLAVIQKLRYKADHEELDLEDGQWEDVHVITGALKLFFRELPEPLFPYSHFNNFVSAIRTPDFNRKLSCIYELVISLPPANHDTMRLLFGHLRRVIMYGDSNRMTVQNVAIVFGPTLLRPEMESQNIAMNMVFQNQIVEFILNQYDRLFYSS